MLTKHALSTDKDINGGFLITPSLKFLGFKQMRNLPANIDVDTTRATQRLAKT
jgi:hypothetical protein